MKPTKKIDTQIDDVSPTFEMDETTAMLALIAQGKREMAEGKVRPAHEAVSAILHRIERTT